MNYHAHIYFQSFQTSQAQILFEACPFLPKKNYDRKVGPHAHPMVEIQFDDSCRDEVLKWIEENRSDLSVFVHQDTGDDLRDHTDGIFWLGAPWTIDFSFFELLETRPELAIHTN
jgi:aromatic ring-cleaving dioxygenase